MTTLADAVIDRLRTALQVNTDSELCRRLELARTTVSTWRGRDSVPYSLCVDLAQKHGLSLDWLLTGYGPMWRAAQEEGMASPPLDPERTAVLALYDALDPDQRREILQVATEKKRLNELEATLQEVLKKLA